MDTDLIEKQKAESGKLKGESRKPLRTTLSKSRRQAMQKRKADPYFSRSRSHAGSRRQSKTALTNTVFPSRK